ncbi:hypothetical protein JCM10207_002525 [Rhodosporidiobolus poonsookiae]
MGAKVDKTITKAAKLEKGKGPLFSMSTWKLSSSSPAHSATRSSSSAAPSSPVRATTVARTHSTGSLASPTASGSGSATMAKATQGRALSASQSEPAIHTSRAKAGSSRAAGEGIAADSLRAAAPTLSRRRSPRLEDGARSSNGEGPSSSQTVRAGASMKEESLSPRRATLRSASVDIKPIVPGSASRPRGADKKGNGVHLELSDSDDEGTHAFVLAPSSVSPATRQRRREALDKRIKKGADGREELDLTFSSPTAALTTAGSDSDEVVVVSRPGSQASIRNSQSSSQASTSARKLAVEPSSMAPSSPSLGKGKERAVEPTPSPSRRIIHLRSVTPVNGAPSPSPGHAVVGPFTPSKNANQSKPGTPSSSAARILRSISKAASLPNVLNEAARSAPGPSSTPRTRAQAAVPSTPQVEVTSASPSSKSSQTTPRGLPQTSNLALLQTPPKSRNSAASSGLPSLTASPATPAHAAAFSDALRALSNRTPGGGPTYIRDPSGSPLSSAGPTPQKPLSRAATMPSLPSSKRRAYEFELVIDKPRIRTEMSADGKRTVFLSRRKPGSKARGLLRRERDGPTSDWDKSERTAEKDSDGDEEMADGTEDGSGSDSEESEYSSAREGSPSPVKPRRPQDEGKGKATSDDEDDEEGHRSSASGSDSGSSSSEEGSDDEDMAALLARARKRLADGTGLNATSPEAASSSTAPTTVSPRKQTSPGVRRSSRATHAPDHYSPTRGSVAASTSAAAGRGVGSSKQKDLLGLSKGIENLGAGKHSFKALVKENERRGKLGIGVNYYANRLAALEGDDDDFGDRSDGSDAADDANAELDQFTSAHAKLAGSALAATGDEDDDDLPPPAALGKKKQEVNALEQVINEERDRKKGKLEAEGETMAEREKRTAWEDRVCRIDSLDTMAKEWRGEGWQGVIAKALKDGIADARRFPSPAVLFSPLAAAGMGTKQQHVVVSRWLLSLICHPSTSSPLADRALSLLHRTILHTARTTSSLEADSVLLSAADLLSGLTALGAKVDDSHKSAKATPAREDSTDPASDDSFVVDDLLGKKVVVEKQARQECVARWCRIVQALSSTSPCILSEQDTASLAGTCVRFSLDPTSATLRSPLSSALSCLLASMPAESSARTALFRLLTAAYRPSRTRFQFAVLETLPYDTLPNKNLRKWLAAAFLASDEAFSAMLAQPTLSASILPAIHTLLDSPPPSSAFRPLANNEATPASDVRLFDQAQVLMVALSDLGEEINVGEGAVDARRVLEEVVGKLGALDAKLRADAKRGLMVERLRAKNLLLALHQSLKFQLRRARGQTRGTFGFSDADEGEVGKREGEGRRGKKRRREEGGKNEEKGGKEKAEEEAEVPLPNGDRMEVDTVDAPASAPPPAPESAPVVDNGADSDDDLELPNFLQKKSA